MGKAIVPRTVRQKKGSGGPIASPPKGLTLAKVTAVTRHFLKNELTGINGPELAQLIAATTPKGERPAFVRPPRSGRSWIASRTSWTC